MLEPSTVTIPFEVGEAKVGVEVAVDAATVRSAESQIDVRLCFIGPTYFRWYGFIQAPLRAVTMNPEGQNY